MACSALPGTMTACDSEESLERSMIERETNFNGTIALSDPSSSPSTVANGSYLRPTSRDELVDALKDMSNCDIRPKKIVVVGGFSSFEFPQLTLADEDSDETLSLRGPTSPHLVVDVSRMNKILHVDKQSLTVTVEAGITYWDLANQLREKGLAVENLSAYPEVTVGGASGTGTHGSGHALHGKNQADQFIALEVVNARGDIQRIVDPRLFTHLGVLGVVTAVTLRCIPMFFLKQACYEFADLDVFDSLRIGAFRELAETDDFYSTMIRIDLVDKMHHPVRC
jgi:FAD/FMN-containing dehydrogenase